MPTESRIEIPSGYQRAIRFGANWTMVISPYSILNLIVIFAVGFASGTAGDMGQTLEFAGKSPVAYGTAVLE